MVLISTGSVGSSYANSPRSDAAASLGSTAVRTIATAPRQPGGGSWLAHWHAQTGDPTIADTILDCQIHNVHRTELQGESMRKKRRGKTVPKS
jgi:hypothetical protein